MAPQCAYASSEAAPCVVRDGPRCYEMRAVCVECRRTAEQIGIPVEGGSVERGALRISVTHDEIGVHVHWSRPIECLDLGADEAVLLAKLLLTHVGAKRVDVRFT